MEQRLPVFLRSLWNEWLFLWLISAKALSWCALGTDKPDPSLPPPAELVYQYSSLRHTLDLLGQSALNSDVNFCCPLKQFYYFSFQLSFEQGEMKTNQYLLNEKIKSIGTKIISVTFQERIVSSIMVV